MALNKITYIGHYCWGKAMHFSNDEKTRIYGWNQRIPRDYDTIAIEYNPDNKKSSQVYVLFNIDAQRDPADMYFADVKLIGTISNDLAKNNSDESNHEIIKLYNNFMRKSILLPELIRCAIYFLLLLGLIFGLNFPIRSMIGESYWNDYLLLIILFNVITAIMACIPLIGIIANSLELKDPSERLTPHI